MKQDTDTKTLEMPVDRRETDAKVPAVRARGKMPAQTIQPQPVVTQPTTPMDLLRIVTERGASVEEISAFMDLMERQRKAEAQQAFVVAMAAFKKNPPTIEKTNTADFTTAKGRTTSTYADLATVCTAVIAALAEHGISHDWSVEQPGAGHPDVGMICVTCTLTHERGHSKSTTLKAPADPSGSKNAIQAIGSTVSYLERYSLLAACGIAVKEMGDDDGHRASEFGGNQPTGKVPTQQERHKLREKGFAAALASIRENSYDAASLRAHYDLSAEQEAELAKLEAELAK